MVMVMEGIRHVKLYNRDESRTKRLDIDGAKFIGKGACIYIPRGAILILEIVSILVAEIIG